MEDLTIVIPTHYRHKYLARILEYYKGISCRLIILDSTDTAYAKASDLQDTIEYTHCPEFGFVAKLAFGLKKVTTPYCVMIADDDFITRKGMEECLKFLRQHPDYDSAEGSYIGFRYLESGGVSMEDIYKYSRSFDYNGTTAIARSMQVFKNYMPFFYSVHRSKNLLDNFTHLNSSKIKNLNLMELFSVLFLIMRGKHKVLPVLYSARELMEFEGYQMISVNDIFIGNQKVEEREDFVKILAGEYAAFDKISIADAEKGIHASVQMYCDFVDAAKVKETVLDRYRKTGFYQFFKLYKNIFIFHARKNLGIKPKAPVETVSDFASHEDWLFIEGIIRKHGITEVQPKKESIVVG